MNREKTGLLSILNELIKWKGVDCSMSITVLHASERKGKPKQIRNKGFIPGVIYGQYLQPKPVQFDGLELNKAVKNNFKTSVLKVKVGEKSNQCIVKSVQRDIINGNIIHVDMQAIREDEEIKLKVPIEFTGRAMLENRNLLLETHLPELELSGRVKDMPDSIEIDLENKQFGDKIEVKDIKLSENITVLNPEEDLIAVITAGKKNSEGYNEEVVS